ncbi:MAG: hypothetical protein AAF184_25455 [Pseudomonadota bacterium]
MRKRAQCVCALLLTAFTTVSAFAGDVRLSLIDGTLRVGGDDAGNRFFLLQNAAGDLIALGFPGTTINGQQVLRIPNATLEDIRVDLGGGGDNLGLGGLEVANDVIINSGDGNDTVIQSNLPITIGGNLIIRLGTGGDGAGFDGLTVGGDIDLRDPQGFQISDFRNTVVAGDLNVVGSIDSDVLLFFESEIMGTLRVTSPGGGSTQISDVVAGELAIDLGTDEQGVAQIFDTIVTGNTTITSGALVDLVDLIDTQVGGAVSVTLGAGDDFVQGANLEVSGTLLFDGGDGVDTLTDGGFTALGGETVINIEIVN